MKRSAQELLSGLMIPYRPRPGPLQQSRVGLSVAWCGAIGISVVVYDNPIIVGALMACAFSAGAICGVTRQLTTAALLALPFALFVAMINPLVTQQGVTVLVEGINVPVLGSLDITLEALAFGILMGFKLIVIMVLAALYVAVVDPDELLRLLRRYSVHSAITASLAVRMVPVLARDAGRLAAARSCRPGPPPGIATTTRAVFARAFERADGAALALETRGFAIAKRLPAKKRPWSSADIAVALGAVSTIVVALLGRTLGVASVSAFPRFAAAIGLQEFVLAALLLIAAVGPIYFLHWQHGVRRD